MIDWIIKFNDGLVCQQLTQIIFASADFGDIYISSTSWDCNDRIVT